MSAFDGVFMLVFKCLSTKDAREFSAWLTGENIRHSVFGTVVSVRVGTATEGYAVLQKADNLDWCTENDHYDTTTQFAWDVREVQNRGEEI